MIGSRFSLAALAVLFAASAVQAQATATVNCTDGTSSKGGKGACSGHGGIAAAKMDAKAGSKMKTAKMDAKADAKAMPAAKPAAKAMAPATADAKAYAKADGKALATCKDGTQSFAKNHTGACSKHGGVKDWLDGTAKK
jgi:uncharacterized protein involved in copper resistance